MNPPFYKLIGLYNLCNVPLVKVLYYYVIREEIHDTCIFHKLAAFLSHDIWWV